jgi:hypothetical protein
MRRELGGEEGGGEEEGEEGVASTRSGGFTSIGFLSFPTAFFYLFILLYFWSGGRVAVSVSLAGGSGARRAVSG